MADPVVPIFFGVFATFALLYTLSFFGSLLFVALNQKKSDKWFMGLPLPIVLLTLMLSQLCLYLHYIPVELFFLILVLAAPASALFIKSVPEERRESAKKYFKVAKVVSIYATIIGIMYFIYSLLSIDQSSSVYKIIMFLMVIYMTFGLPFIGTCLVFMAKEKQAGASVPKHVHKPGF